MDQLKKNIDPNSEQFIKNLAHTTRQVETLKKIVHTIKAQPVKSGKQAPRQRIQALIDPDTFFLEFSELAGYQLYDTAVPAGGLITGIGTLHNQACVIIANDPSVKGGCYYPITVKKHLRAQEIALENKLPCVYLVDSGGVYLPKQADTFADKEHFGRVFFYQSQLSAQDIPQLAIVMGVCTAGAAYIATMSDECIMIKQQSALFLAGPLLVKAAIGESVTTDALGGSDLHCRTSGVADYCVNTEKEALEKARNLAQYWPSRKVSPLFKPLAPASSNQLYGLINHNPRYPAYTVHTIIAELVDGSLFSEFKTLHAPTLVCGFARIEGYPVGIVANNGILFSNAALKGAHFIQLCAKRQIPLVFLQNITGFMVGQHSEKEGISKHSTKMVHAVACANVPKLTVIIGGSFGAGNYAMCGRAYQPRFLWVWPNARVGVMGGEQAAHILEHLYKNKKKPADLKKLKKNTLELYQTQSHAYYGSARLWDDGIIDPLDTRKYLAQALRVSLQTQPSKFGLFRM